MILEYIVREYATVILIAVSLTAAVLFAVRGKIDGGKE